MFEIIPTQLLNSNIHIFYEYFKNLLSKVKKSHCKIKNIFQDFILN